MSTPINTQCSQRSDPEYDPADPTHDASRMLNGPCPHPATVEIDGRSYCAAHGYAARAADRSAPPQLSVSEAAAEAHKMLRSLPEPGWSPQLVSAAARVIDAWLRDTGQHVEQVMFSDLSVLSPFTGADTVTFGSLVASEIAAAEQL